MVTDMCDLFLKTQVVPRNAIRNNMYSTASMPQIGGRFRK
jgi:hypothetical protein